MIFAVKGKKGTNLMSMVNKNESFEAETILSLVTQERSKALSPREWRHRLAGYGYGIENTTEGMIVTKLPFGNALCMVPHAAAA
jgi:hypothetical protein